MSDDDRSGTVKKLIAAGATLDAGAVANRALSTQEEPPPPRAQPMLLPTVPVHEERVLRSWVASVELDDRGRRR